MHRSRISCRPMFGTTQRRSVTTTGVSDRVDSGIWLVSIWKRKPCSPGQALRAKTVTHVSGRSVTYVSGTDRKGLAPHLGTTHPIATCPFHPISTLAVRRGIRAAALKHGFHKSNIALKASVASRLLLAA